MLSDLTPIATLPVADQDRAREFYEGTLGLKPVGDEGPGGVFYACGSGQLFVYTSAFAGTNKATAVTFSTDRAAFDATVEALRNKGITFLTFDFDGMTWEGDVAVSESMRGVWFTDPDGNILNIGTM